MWFNSLEFAAFFAIVYSLYLLVGWFGKGTMGRWLWAQNVLLLVASYWFYAAWDWRFLGLLAVSTVVDYWVGLALATDLERTGAPKGRKGLLLISLIVNLGILGTFKYYDFFVQSAADLLSGFGMEANLPLLKVVLPVGISFYTFQTIAYTYSVYKRETPATRDPVAFAVYVAYFPQLVAGPIERARMLLPQIHMPRKITLEKLKSGALLVLQGLFKKVAIADAVAGYVDAVFSNPQASSSGTIVLGVYMFALQIYGDFSGYTDIARGLSRMMGIELILNFRQPYLASNITDFWRRWHISLSTWLKEHLYIPMGGNRRGESMMYRNLMLTMLLGGLWHGAGWQFVIWGGLHGLYLAVHKFWMASTGRQVDDVAPGPLRRVVGVVITFHLVCFAWIFFRATDVEHAWMILQGIGACDFRLTDQVPPTAMLLLAVALILDFYCVVRDRQVPIDDRTPVFLRGLVCGSAVVMMILANSSGDVPFIYFQF